MKNTSLPKPKTKIPDNIFSGNHGTIYVSYESVKDNVLCPSNQSFSQMLKYLKHGKASDNTALIEEEVKYNNKISKYKCRVITEPHHAEIYFKQGLAHLELQNFDQALKSFNETIQADPHYAAAYYRKGALLLNHLKEPQQAVLALDEALEINPCYIEAYYVKGYALIELKYYRQAIESFDQITNIGPDSNHNILNCHGIYSKAIESPYPDIYAAKALALEHLQDWGGALKCYNKLIETQPKSAANLYMR